uniref:Reverse transcriptase domain-containing protein n=1 Tax=Manihot esculenta TaxID=3983 RepID=A0A199U943_MANES
MTLFLVYVIVIRNGDKHCFSFDLKSATDRWPLLSMFYLMQVCFGRQFASAVVNSALGTNVFEVSWVKRRSVVCFQTGQPLGYYSSWPLFALTHHAMIWWCAEQVYPQRVFYRYAVLGDDVVIAAEQVEKAPKQREVQQVQVIGDGLKTSKSSDYFHDGGQDSKEFLISKAAYHKHLTPYST